MTLPQLKALSSAQPFRTFFLETTGGNFIGVDQVDHVLFPPPDHDIITVFDSEGLVRHITLEQINTWAVK